MLVLLLFLGGLVLFFCVLFIPGGILGTVGLISISGSIFLAFRTYPPETAWLIFAGELLAVGVGVVIGLRLFPYTPIGRRLTLAREFDASEGFTSASAELENYVGKQGVAVTILRPAGIALIEGKRVNVVTHGDFIKRDSRVRVSEVEGNRIVVEPINEKDATA